MYRGSVEADVENGRERVESDSEEEREMLVRRSQYSECSQAADRSASFCRTIALIVSTRTKILLQLIWD